MNTTRFVSRFFIGFLAVATIVLTGGCASSSRMVVPYDRPYQYDFWYLHAGSGYGHRPSVGGGCTTTRYDSAIPFTVAVPCAPSANGSTIPGAGLERSRYSLNQLKTKLAEAQMIDARHCAYSAAPDQRWSIYKCQDVVNELAFLQREMTKEERAVGAQCRRTLSERTGQQTIQTRECSETNYGSWR